MNREQFEPPYDRYQPRPYRGGRFRHHRSPRKGDKIGFGLVIICIGVFILLKKLGLFYFDWHTFWPIILIAVGLFIGISKSFRGHGWWILMLIGGAFMIPEFTIMGARSSSLVFPAALIIGGLMMVFRPKRNIECKNGMEVVTNGENTLNIDVTFGGRKEVITSKDFKGGNISTTFGGVEVNMLHADTAAGQPVVLNLQVSFGGVELIVPSHWELQNEIQPTLGSVEDHRSIRPTGSGIPEEKKTLILRGSCNFGSVEIKSY